MALALPAPARAQGATGTDVDLAALGLDPSAPAFDDKLNIYGFTALDYTATHFSHLVLGAPDTHGFAAGNLNVYLAKNLTEKWRTLAEVSFLYLPNGGQGSDGSTTVTTIDDPTNFDRPITWGGIAIERAYAEYDVDSRLTIRAGRFLTPYGIWNTDHGAPAIIAPFRPYVIGDAYFPEHQTGLELFGKTLVGDYRIGYHATVTNGRSPVEPVSDPDGKPAFGGRIEVEAPWAGALKLGLSGYWGHYTGVAAVGSTPDSYDERSYGGDAQWDHGALHLQLEVIANSRAYPEGNRPLVFGRPAADGTRTGGYILGGYRFTQLWNIMPFYFFEDNHPSAQNPDQTARAHNLGVNFRPIPSVVLKAMFSHVALAADPFLGSVHIYVVSTQLAWVF
jgi:hypothetical protein